MTDSTKTLTILGNSLTLNFKGSVNVLDFLNAAELEILLNAFHEKHPEGVNGFYTSTFATDTDYRKTVDELIQNQMKRNLENYFFDYKIHCGSYIVKGADEKSAGISGTLSSIFWPQIGRKRREM